MAQEGDIVFMIGADVAGLTRAGQAGEQSLAEMEKAARKMESQLLAMGKTAMEFKGSVANLAKENKALYETLRDAGEAAKASQKHYNDLLSVNGGLAQSARDSAAAFEAFDKARAQVDNLKASIDPLFAASKRYEAALMQLDSALEMGAISAREHSNMVDALAASYLRADAAADVARAGMGGFGGGVQQIGYQIQDFAVQVGAGTSATQAFAQQFPQLASAFGPVGVAVGTLGAIAIPALAAAFGDASTKATTMEAAVGNLSTAVSDLNAITQLLNDVDLTGIKEQFGSLSAEVLNLLTVQRELAIMDAMNGVHQAIAAAVNSMDGLITTSLDGIKSAFDTTYDNARSLQALMADIQKAATPEEALQAVIRLRQHIESTVGPLAGLKGEAFEMAKGLVSAESNLRQVVEQSKQSEAAMRNAAGQTVAAGSAAMALERNMAAAYQVYAMTRGMASDLADETERASRAAAAFSAYQAELSRTGQSSGPDSARSLTQFGGGAFRAPVQGAGLAFEGAGGGGGGGGGTNPVEAQLEALRQQLMTEEQLEMESWARRQEMLQQALDQRLLTQQEYAALMEQAQQQHSDKMSEIDVWRYGSTLDKASTFFGDMASALQGGNDRMAKIAKKFAAAEALINAWRAFSQTMADPTLPFIAKIPSAISALAAGMSAVSALGGGGGGGAGGVRGAAGAGATQQQQAPTQTMNFTVTNDPFGFGERLVRQLVTQLNEAQRNGSSIRATFGTA